MRGAVYNKERRTESQLEHVIGNNTQKITPNEKLNIVAENHIPTLHIFS